MGKPPNYRPLQRLYAALHRDLLLGCSQGPRRCHEGARRVLGDATKEQRVTTVQRNAVLQALEQRRSVLLAHLAGHRLHSQTCAACGRDMLFPAGLRSDGDDHTCDCRFTTSYIYIHIHICGGRQLLLQQQQGFAVQGQCGVCPHQGEGAADIPVHRAHLAASRCYRHGIVHCRGPGSWAKKRGWAGGPCPHGDAVVIIENGNTGNQCLVGCQEHSVSSQCQSITLTGIVES